MAQIPPIDDAYINEIIKSNGPYNPSLLKTQGVKMRELIKLLRDRMEQGDRDVVHTTGDESISGTKTFTLIKAEGLSVNNLANFSMNTVISPLTGVQTKLLSLSEGTFGVQLSASVLAASRSQLLQDRDGVIALTEDLSGFATLSQFYEELASKVDNAARGVPGGVSTLDSGGKIPASQLPDSISGALIYQGTWDADTNVPALVDPPAFSTKGYYYVTNTAGTQFGITLAVGDWIVSNGTAWEKVDNSDAVTTVFGRLGNVLANEADYNAFYPLLTGSYADPNWITSLPYSKITGTPDLGDGSTLNNSISGNAATATNSTQWNGQTYINTLRTSPFSFMVNSNGSWGYTGASQVREVLGIPLGGETLQSVLTRGNTSTLAIQAGGHSVFGDATGCRIVLASYGFTEGLIRSVDPNGFPGEIRYEATLHLFQGAISTPNNITAPTFTGDLAATTATVANSPIHPTDVVRLQDLQNYIPISGTYKPTITGTTPGAILVAHYVRIGNQVTVSGTLGINDTAHLRFNMSLPINSDFTSIDDLSGVSTISSSGKSITVYGDTTNNTAEFSLLAADAGGSTSSRTDFVFIYTVK